LSPPELGHRRRCGVLWWHRYGASFTPCRAHRPTGRRASGHAWPTRCPTRRPSCAAAGGIRWRAGWPDCSPRTPGSVRSCWPLVTANDYGLHVYNGDTGVVIAGPDDLRAVISSATGPLGFSTSRLSDVETMHAMTIHKSQGSPADEVTVLMPSEDSRLLSRELFYTAVTRAKTKVRVVGSAAAVRAAIGRRAVRASGLAQRVQSFG
jgi:UvrD-like helicase C-terminal domain